MTKQPPKSLLESALDILREAASGNPYASQAQLARATGESEANISRWLSGASIPTLRKLEPVLMALGVRLILGPGPDPVPPGRVKARARLRFRKSAVKRPGKLA